MGTTSVRMSMIETKKMIVNEFSYSNDRIVSKVLSHANGSGGMWILRNVVEIKEMKEYNDIIFVKMEHRNGETSFKEISYEMHPYLFDVPLKWLEQVSPQSKEGIEWCEMVKRIQNVSLSYGIEFVFNERKFKLIDEISKKYWRVIEIGSGKAYKLSKENIVDSILKG